MASVLRPTEIHPDEFRFVIPLCRISGAGPPPEGSRLFLSVIFLNAPGDLVPRERG